MSQVPSLSKQLNQLKKHLGSAQTRIFFGRVLDISITPNVKSANKTALER